jgi:DNA-binding transcriptional ArsR family regulator
VAGDDDVLFRALADPVRRALLDRLHGDGPATLTELCEVEPAMTRFGVMKHLRVLEAAELVVTERVGRTKVHHLNPVPIARLADRWIHKFSRPATRALLDLQDVVDADRHTDHDTGHHTGQHTDRHEEETA